MPLLSVILETRGHSATMIGLNTAVAGLASIAAAPLATPLAMRFGVVWTMLAMIVVGALAFVGFYFAPSFWMWFPLRVVLHVALTVLFILSEFWISTSAPPQPARLRARHLRDRAVARLRLRPLAVRADGQRRLPAVRRDLRAGHAGRDSRCWPPGAKARRSSTRRRAEQLPALYLAGADRDRRGAGFRRGRDRRLRAVSGLWQPHRLFGGRRGAAAHHDRPRQRHPADPARHGQRPHRRPPHPAARLRRGRACRHARCCRSSPTTGT